MTNKISIVITTHGEARDLPGILNSLRMQRNCVVGQDSRDPSKEYRWALGARCEHPIEVIVVCDGKYNGTLSGNVDKIIECPKEGGVGHHTREPGIMAATGDWVVLTNSDNFFFHGWLSRLSEYLNPKVGMVYWDLVSNLWKWTNFGGCRLRRGHVDLSSACIRTSIARTVGFPFRDYDGDWDYVWSCARIAKDKELQVTHLAETLSVHN